MSLRPPALLVLLSALVVGLVFTIAPAPAPAHAAESAVGTFYPVAADRRIVDTRSGLGAAKATVPAGGEIKVKISPTAQISAGAAAAVVVNLTGLSPTASTWLIAYASGTVRPHTSNLNLQAGVTRANLATVTVGSDGYIRIYNAKGSVHVIVDVLGYYGRVAGAAMGSQYYLSTPTRIYDSRAVAGGGGPLRVGAAIDVYLDYGADNPDVVAVTINLYAVRPQRAGYLVAWNGVGKPTGSTVNFRAGSTVPNLTVVPTRTANGRPTFSVANGSSAPTELAADVMGVYLKGQDAGLRYVPIVPKRTVDTRDPSNGSGARVLANATRSLTAVSTGAASVAGPATYGLVGNVSALAPTESSYLAVYATGEPRPGVDNVKTIPGAITGNAAVVGLSNAFAYSIYNRYGTVDVIVDVTGRMDLYVSSRAAGTAAGARRTVAPRQDTPITGGSARPQP